MGKTKAKFKNFDFYQPKIVFDQPHYSPNRFLNRVADVVGVKNDRQLSGLLKLSQATISKIRTRKYPMSEASLLRIVEATGWSIKQARKELGEFEVMNANPAEA